MKLKKSRIKIMEIENAVDRENFIYRASEYTYSFENFQTIKTFGRDIYVILTVKLLLKKADKEQQDLLIGVMNFKKKKQNHKIQKKYKKKMFFKTCMHILIVEKKSLMFFKVKHFQ